MGTSQVGFAPFNHPLVGTVTVQLHSVWFITRKKEFFGNVSHMGDIPFGNELHKQTFYNLVKFVFPTICHIIQF